MVKCKIIYKPDDVVVTKTADFLTDGTDGYIYYTTLANDLDVIGVWKLQGHIAKSGEDKYSTITKFSVFKNLE